MNNEIAMKQHVLDMLKEFMLGEDGKKFKPKEMSIEIIKPEHDDTEEMEEMHEPEEEMTEEPECEDEMEEGGKKKMSLKDFLASKS